MLSYTLKKKLPAPEEAMFILPCEMLCYHGTGCTVVRQLIGSHNETEDIKRKVRLQNASFCCSCPHGTRAEVCLMIPELILCWNMLWKCCVGFFCSFVQQFLFSNPMSLCLVLFQVEEFLWSWCVLNWSILALCTNYLAVYKAYTCAWLSVSEDQTVSTNGKFPSDLLHSHLFLSLSFISVIPPFTTSVVWHSFFLSSRERTENTACHKSFGGPFPVPWQCVYNSSALRLLFIFESAAHPALVFGVMSQPRPCKSGILWLWQQRTYLTLLRGAAAL